MSNRREFIKHGGAGVVGAAALGSALTVAAQAQGANDEIVLGAIGCGGQGTGLIKRFAALKGVRVAFVCDPDEARARAAAEVVTKITGKAPEVVTDLRRVLDDKSVAAVTVATPDHWHAPATILACDAGKHIYVEKPCSHNFREGRLMVDAARRTGRVVQLGTQSRSNPRVGHAIGMLHDGLIGDVLVAKAFDVQLRKNIGHAKPGPAPAGFDYDLWVGPAPFVPFQANRHHYNWHWWYDFGTGDMGNDGVHELDIARWGLGVDTHPSAVAALGGKFVFDDDQQFPDTQTVIFDYPGDGKPGARRQIMFEMRIWSPYQPDGEENGNIFYGTEGWMLLCKKGVVKAFDRKNKPLPLKGEPPRLVGHEENFITSVRTGSTPSAEIAVGFVSTALCHLGNVAARVGRTLRFDPVKEQILGDADASRLLGRTYRDGHWAVPKGV